ncbi:GNAT family N-acetyltransferase [Streptomyces tsukubensis]|uniref:GNAT family N-acetyltransferase n=1 Tax=Streptomyces tsukubensis TaxID=83656 RepID=A0A1V4A7J9_9ACTN|nr:GNAT family N-acetyltransferase [Streptomyces tsukubensis]OON77618.1 GNAT family N-acetyltransferase [Streptomyces tsukubensis]QFR93121.1 GNAT family N-acetyltransferase [Streptomyces tsukubensis]
MTPVVVRVAEDPTDREACFAVRREVFVVEQRVPRELEYDAHDEPGADAVQVLALHEDGRPLGTGRLLYGPSAEDRTGGDPTVGALGRLAVLGAARGLGIGVALVRAIEDAARARGLAHVDLHAQTHALGFYERLGYEAYGQEFQDAGIPHRAMRRALG